MSDVIQCPQCDKKFRLPARVPATFTCTNCSTVMDLSDFGGAAEPAAPSGRAQQGGAPQSRRSRAKGGGGRRRGSSSARTSSAARSSSAAPSRSRGGRSSGRSGRAGPEDEYDEYDDEPQGRRGRQKKSNAPLIIGSVAGLMVAVVLVVIAMKKKDDVPQAPEPGTTAAAGVKPGATPGSGTPAASSAVPGAAGTAPAGSGAAGSPAAAGAASKAAPFEGPMMPIRKPGSSGKGRYKRMSKVKLEIFPWSEEIDAETRAKAEEGIKAMYSGGRDWDDAQDWFIAQGRPLCGRLISEFKTIQDTNGLENPEGKSYVGALDSLLRKIDGWMERKWKSLDAVRAHSHPNEVIGSCRRWTWWWKYDEWKNNERKPWDPFEDESDDTDTGIKAPEKKKSKKGKGFGTRAGGG